MSEKSMALYWSAVSFFQASDLQNGVLDDSISKNLYLHFPRLSSQEMFETLCPAERSVKRKRYMYIHVESGEIFFSTYFSLFSFTGILA